MKIWAIINPPPIAYDTAYLLGRVMSRAEDVHVTKFSNLSQLFRDAPDKFDIVLNRTITSDVILLEELEEFSKKRGARLLNSSVMTARACDKRTYLEDYDRYIPDSWMIDSLDDLKSLHDKVGFELDIKNPFGKFGNEVGRFDGRVNDPAIVEIIAGCKGSGFVVQRYCAGFLNGDKRVIVHRRVDGDFEIVAWYLRIPAKGNWISNLSAGGRIASAPLTKAEAEFSVSGAAAPYFPVHP